MDNITHTSKFIWFFAVIGILAVVIIVIVAIVVPKQTNAPAQKQADTADIPEFKPVVTKVANEKLPDKFPADLPLETGAKVVDNYNATSTSGNVQATREYESAKTPEQNYGVYNDFFNKNNWEVLTSSNTTTDRSLTVRKEQTVIQVLFYQNTVTKASVVRVNVTVLAQSK